jgi:hypothetical protein
MLPSIQYATKSSNIIIQVEAKVTSQLSFLQCQQDLRSTAEQAISYLFENLHIDNKTAADASGMAITAFIRGSNQVLCIYFSNG